MAGKIIMWIVSFGCGILFFTIGDYARKQEKPIWFWTGTKVDPLEITDIKQYNKENSTMWKLYSLWYFAAGLAEIWNTLAAAMILVLSCTIGLILLVRSYNKIYKKYSVQ